MRFTNHLISIHNRVRLLALVLVLAGCLLLPAGHTPAPHLHSVLPPDQLIVVLQPAVNPQDTARAAATLLDQFGSRGLVQLDPLGIEGPVPNAPVYRAHLSPGVDATTLATALRDSPLVARAEPNVLRHTLSIDTQTDTQSGPHDAEFSAQDYYQDIGVVAMWARGLTGNNPDRPLTVAVIDTGVDVDHPDIDANLVPGFDFVELDAVAQDASTNSHGSSVAGIIGAEINNDLDGVGIARGVAGIGGGDALTRTPGLRIMPLRVVSDKSGVLDCATIAEAIDHARTHGAQIINISIGGAEPCSLEQAAVERAHADGLAVIAAAGNGNSAAPFYPAAYGAGTNDRMVIAVAGVEPDGVKAEKSNYGSWVDIAAPFQNVRTITNDGGYATRTGTSFSTPFVSGLLGVLMSNYGWTRDQAIEVILTTADNLDGVNPDYQGQLGAGRMNADRASTVSLPAAASDDPPIYTIHLPILVTNE